MSAIKPVSGKPTLQVFSDQSLQDSQNDDYRFDSSMWYYDSFM
ncbi:hypothetical protein [Psychroflexus aurantiacus]|nr:hypothetical protein [Psychroflexus aurantiacus]